MISVVKVRQTCSACPSQWDGETDDGKMVYVRFRWGHLAVTVGKDIWGETPDGVRVVDLYHGDGLAGFMDYMELRELTKDVVTWPDQMENDAGEDSF